METFLIVLAALSWRPGAMRAAEPVMPVEMERPTNQPKKFEFTAPEAVNVSVGQIRSLPDKLLLT